MRSPAVRILGKLCLSVGTGVLLFVAWEYWGTGLYTAHEQDRLAEQLDASIERGLAMVVPVMGPFSDFDPGPGDPVFRIKIPAIDLNDGKGFVVVEGVGEDELARGPGHYPACGGDFGPPLCAPFPAVWPGLEGRTVVSGHRTTHLAPFLDTGELERGDEIVVEAVWGTFTYRVYAQRSVDPGDATIVAEVEGRQELVLTTCDPPLSAARRLITYARLVPT